MKAKGFGRIFIFCIIALVVLLSIKNILQKKQSSLNTILSKVNIVSKKPSKRFKTGNHLVGKILEQLEVLEVKEDEIQTQ